MADRDEIAIVGVGCRFPGADNLSEFWSVLVNGENHVKEIPKDRWNIDVFYDADPNKSGKTYVRNAGFINRYDYAFNGNQTFYFKHNYLLFVNRRFKETNHTFPGFRSH